MANRTRTARFETIGELLKQLGGISPRRLRAIPPPGEATERDLLAVQKRTGRLYELVDGALVEKAMGYPESLLAGVLLKLLGNFLDRQDRGVVAGADGAMRLMPGLVRVPDVSFVSWDRFPGRVVPNDPIAKLAPDLAVEVLSKGNTKGEMARKLRDYFLAGVRLVWFVNPKKRTTQVFTAPDECVVLGEDQTLDGGDVLPGFSLPLRQLFDRIPVAPPRAGKGKGRKPGKRS